MLEDILSQYEGTLIVVSHDRDFLDQTVTKILAFEGDGVVEGHIGGYSDYLAATKTSAKTAADVSQAVQKTEKSTGPAVKASSASANGRDGCACPSSSSMSWSGYAEKIDALHADIEMLTATLADPELYGRDPAGFQKAARRPGRSARRTRRGGAALAGAGGTAPGSGIGRRS